MNLLIMKIVTSLLRHLLTAAGAWLVAEGKLDVGQVETLTGAVLTVVGLGWSVIDKRGVVKLIGPIISGMR